jgi:hypothetical protein
MVHVHDRPSLAGKTPPLVSGDEPEYREGRDFEIDVGNLSLTSAKSAAGSTKVRRIDDRRAGALIIARVT